MANLYIVVLHKFCQAPLNKSGERLEFELVLHGEFY